MTYGGIKIWHAHAILLSLKSNRAAKQNQTAEEDEKFEKR